MISGGLMIYHYGIGRSFDIKIFYIKQIKKIYVPLWISYVVIFCIGYFVMPEKYLGASITNCIAALLALDYFSNIGLGIFALVGEWFTTVIILLYLLFPFLRLLFKSKYRIPITFFIFISCLMNMHFQIMSFWNGWFSITNGILYFWIGMLFEYYKKQVYCRINLVFSVILCLVLLVTNPYKLLAIDYLPTFIISVCLYFILMNINNIKSSFIIGVNKIGYEIYLIHHRIYYWLMPIMVNRMDGIVDECVVFIILFIVIYSNFPH